MKLPLRKGSQTCAPAEVGQETSCEAVWDLLSLYADSETTCDEAAMVESHIAVCVDCARDLEFMRSTQATFSDLPEVAPPPDLRAAILAATVDRQPAPNRLAALIHKLLAPAPARYGFAIAAGMAGILVAVGIHRGLGPVGGPTDNPAAYQPGAKMASAIPPAAPSLPSIHEPGWVLAPTPKASHPATQPAARLLTRPYSPLTLASHRSLDARRLIVPGSSVGVARKSPAQAPAPKTDPSDPLFAAGEMKLKTPIAEAKPNTTASDDATTHTADMVVMMDPAPTKTASASETPEKKEAEMAPAAAPAPRSSRLVLISSSSPETVGQVSSFAELKRALKNRDLDGARAIEQSIKAREIRLPVYRKTF